MKKKLLISSIIFALIFTVSCLTKKEIQQTQVENQQQTAQEEPKTEDIINEESTERPIAVMIDNEGIATSRHSGLDKAYVVYEMVVEGTESRIMAIFKDVNPTAIGPVRSARHYFIHYALENDAIYVHFGWSPLAQQTIRSMMVNNINGILGTDGSIFWRNPKKRNDWHNAFTSMEKIKKMIKQKKYDEISYQKVFNYSPAEIDNIDGVPISEVHVDYSTSRKIKYEYDSTTKLFKRFLKDEPHVDAVSHSQYTAKNIIIEKVKNYPLNDGPDKNGTFKNRQQMDTVGNGKGYFITNGTYKQITWEKTSITGRTVYRYLNGEEVMFNKGQIWIQIVPLYTKISFK